MEAALASAGASSVVVARAFKVYLKYSTFLLLLLYFYCLAECKGKFKNGKLNGNGGQLDWIECEGDGHQLAALTPWLARSAAVFFLRLGRRAIKWAIRLGNGFEPPIAK